jgi:hypothetical protein
MKIRGMEDGRMEGWSGFAVMFGIDIVMLWLSCAMRTEGVRDECVLLDVVLKLGVYWLL